MDGSTKDSRESTISIVIRNHNSEVINYHAEKCGISTPLKTEALAIRKSPALAKKLRLDQIMIESDNLTVVSHIFREANAVADLLAKLCHTTLPEILRTHQEL
ncbi:hypothetical protein V2J09_001485 [Rumex salicifolius]